MNKIKTIIFLLCIIFSVTAYAQSYSEAHTQLKNSKIEINSSSLVLYASQGDLLIVSLLIRAGISPSDSEPQHTVTALHAAAGQGHLKVISELLKLAAPVNAVDACGYTPLMVAAYFAQFYAVSLLVKHDGSMLDHQASCGLTPLIAAVQSGNLKIVDVLLSAGAKPHISDVFGNTPLKIANLSKRVEIAKRIQAALIKQ